MRNWWTCPLNMNMHSTHLILEAALLIWIKEALDSHSLVIPPGLLDSAVRSFLKVLRGLWRMEGVVG